MDLPTHDDLLARIDAFLDRHGMAESRFGRDATGEGDLVSSIRKGRSPTLKMLHRITAFMAECDAVADATRDAA